MKTQTIIHSNGSKWHGQEPDTISKLIEVLKTNTIEERFFCKLSKGYGEDKRKYTLCPISKNDEKTNYVFFGNFEEVSHVFNIETNDKKIINKLKKAIIENKGWGMYLKRLKLTAPN